MKINSKKTTTLIVLLMLFLSGCESPHNVSVIKDDGLTRETIEVSEGSLISEPNIPMKEGHTFMGWYSDNDYDVTFDFTQPINKGVSIYAKWDINTYSMTFKDEEGVIQWVYQTQYNTDLTNLVVSAAIDVKEGYEFSGWDNEIPNTMPANDLVFNAKYTFLFGLQSPGFLNIPNEQIVQYGTEIDLLSLGIKAIDFIEGDLTNDISVNITDTSILTVGDYEVVYSITDNDGYESIVIINLTVIDTSTNFLYHITDLNEIEIIGCFERTGTDIVIPNSIGGLPVTKIGDYAFGHVVIDSHYPSYYGATSVVLPDSITSIGKYAFYRNELTSIYIPAGVEYIGEHAFDFNKLTSFIVSDNNPYFTTVDGVLFNKDITTLIKMISDDLRSTYIIPNSVTSIGDYAFSGNMLESVTMGDSIISIGDYAFSGNKLTSLFIPNSVTTIGNKIFGDDQSISYIVLESNPNFTVIDDVLFSKDITILIDTQFKDIRTSYTIPNSVEIIRDYAFEGNQLTEIIIPNSVTTIGNYAFWYNELVSLVIPDSVITIGDRAFSNNQLSSLIIGENLTTIGEEAFSRNQLTSLIIPNSVNTIGNYAFNDNQLISVILPEGLIIIPNGIFEGNQITSIIIPDSVIIIGRGAFMGNQLTSLTIPSGVLEIGDYAFQQNQLTGVLILNSVIIIGEAAFSWNQLTSIVLPDSLNMIGDNAFRSNQLTSVVLPDSITSIGDYSFYENQLVNVLLPNSLISIGEHAFDGNQLPSVVFPNSLVSIGNDAFSNNQLTSIIIPSSVTIIERNAFANNQITNVTLSEGITTFERGAFASNQITSITIFGDITIYNSVWFRIGFPRMVKPS